MFHNISKFHASWVIYTLHYPSFLEYVQNYRQAISAEIAEFRTQAILKALDLGLTDVAVVVEGVLQMIVESVKKDLVSNNKQHGYVALCLLLYFIQRKLKNISFVCSMGLQLNVLAGPTSKCG